MVSHFLAVFLFPYHSDAWSRSQPPAVQAGQIQYFTPLSFASWAAFARFLAVSAPKNAAPSFDSKKGITWSMEFTSSFSSFFSRAAAFSSSAVPAASRYVLTYLFQPAVAAGRIHDFFDLVYDFFFCHKNHPFCSNII